MYKIKNKVCKGRTIIGYNLINLGINQEEYKDLNTAIVLAEDGWIEGVGVKLLGNKKILVDNGLKLSSIPSVQAVELSNDVQDTLQLKSILNKVELLLYDIELRDIIIDADGKANAEKKFKTYVDFKVVGYKSKEKEQSALDILESHINKIANANGTCIESIKRRKNDIEVKFIWSNMTCISNTLTEILLGKKVKVKMRDAGCITATVLKVKGIEQRKRYLKVKLLCTSKGKIVTDYTIPEGYCSKVGVKSVLNMMTYIETEVKRYINTLV